MRFKFRFLPVALAAAMLTATLGGCGTTGPTTDPGNTPGNTDTPARPTAFDEDNIVLSFSAMSDIHQQMGKTQYADMLFNALDYAKELNGGDLDLALFAGDLTEETWRQTGQNDNYRTDYNADVAMLKETLERSLDLTKTAVFYALGNHDTDPSGIGVNKGGVELMAQMPALFHSQLGEQFFTADAEDSIPDAGLRHAIVNGYHFLAVNPDTYWNLRGYSDETLTWLDNQLKSLTEANPDQYVFVTAHPPMYGTVFGSFTNDWADRDVQDVLSKYPQVVYFSGHIHNVLQDEIQISQDGFFTAVDCGSVKYTGIMNDINDARNASFDNSLGTRFDDFSQGLLVQVDKNGNVRINRCDFYQRNTMKDPWELSYPQEDNSHLLPYDNDSRRDNNVAPVFAEDATFDVTKTGDTLTLRWDAATDDDMVRYYRIVVSRVENGKSTRVEVLNIATFTYQWDSVEDMPKEFTYSKVVNYSGEYTFECYPVDIWGAQGKAITATLTV